MLTAVSLGSGNPGVIARFREHYRCLHPRPSVNRHSVPQARRYNVLNKGNRGSLAFVILDVVAAKVGPIVEAAYINALKPHANDVYLDTQVGVPQSHPPRHHARAPARVRRDPQYRLTMLVSQVATRREAWQSHLDQEAVKNRTSC